MRRKNPLRSLIVGTGLLLAVSAHGARAQETSTGKPHGAAAEAPVPVFVVGAVRSPSRLKFSPGMRVAELLACCSGGVLPSGNENQVRVYRSAPGKIEPELIKVDLKAIRKHHAADVRLSPYDIIEVGWKNGHRHGYHGANSPIKFPFRVID